jgi:hypothetical protein
LKLSESENRDNTDEKQSHGAAVLHERNLRVNPMRIPDSLRRCIMRVMPFTRPRRVLLTVAVLVLTVVGVGVIWPWLQMPLLGVLLLVVLVSATVGRNFFRGRAAMRNRDYARATAEFEAYLRFLDSNTGRLVPWIGVGMYTLNGRALTLNNIGVCHLETGERDRAREYWTRALALDPLYAVPNVNLAIAAQLDGNRIAASEYAARATHLGYDSSALQTALRKALARTNEAVGRVV